MANTKELFRLTPDYPMALGYFLPKTITLHSAPGNKAESKESVSFCIPMETSALAHFQEGNLKKCVVINSATVKSCTHSQAAAKIACVSWTTTTN